MVEKGGSLHTCPKKFMTRERVDERESSQYKKERKSEARWGYGEEKVALLEVNRRR